MTSCLHPLIDPFRTVESHITAIVVPSLVCKLLELMKVVKYPLRLLLKKNYWMHKCHIQRIYDGFHPLHDIQFMFLLYNKTQECSSYFNK